MCQPHFHSNSSAFGGLLQATPILEVAFGEMGVALACFTHSPMTNQRSDWSWAELLLSIHKVGIEKYARLRFNEQRGD